MREAYMGIDPGQKGYIVVYDTSKRQYYKEPLASETLVDFLEQFAHLDCMAVIEKVGAMPGQGRTSIFTFGYNAGRVVGILEAMGIPYTHVTPQKWQKEMWDSNDKITIAGKVDNKRTSHQAAKRLHPNMSFKRTDKCKTFDDNMVDATLLCDYGMRKNL
jgi:hypothetical protein